MPRRHPRRVPRLSYFFPAHNEAANLGGLVEEALATLPALAETFEIITVNDGSRDRDPGDRRRARGRAPGGPRRPPPDEPRLRRGAPLGLRGRPLRARRVHRRRPPVPGRGPRPADRAPRPRHAGRRRRLPDQARRPARPDRLRAALPARQPDLLRPQGPRRRLRLQAVPARGARGRARRVGRGVLLGRAAHQAPGRGRAVVEVGVPHYPRTAGSPTGAKPSGGLPGGRDFWRSASGCGSPSDRRAAPRRRRSFDSRDPGPPRSAAGAALRSRAGALAGSTSSELTNSRNTSSRGSTALAGRFEGGRRRLAPRRSARRVAVVAVVVRPGRGPLGGEDRDA